MPDKSNRPQKGRNFGVGTAKWNAGQRQCFVISGERGRETGEDGREGGERKGEKQKKEKERKIKSEREKDKRMKHTLFPLPSPPLPPQ